MKAISSLVNVDSIDNDKNLEGGFSAESSVMSDPQSLTDDSLGDHQLGQASVIARLLTINSSRLILLARILGHYRFLSTNRTPEYFRRQ